MRTTSTIWNVQGTVSDIPFRISMEELQPEWWQVQCTYVLHCWLICCIIWYNYSIFCPTDCVTILFHVFCQYTTFKLALIISATILWLVYKISNLCHYSIGLPKNFYFLSVPIRIYLIEGCSNVEATEQRWSHH